MNNYRYRKCCNKMSNNNDETECDNSMDINQSSCSLVSNNQNQIDRCACGFDMNNNSMFPENPMLAQSYVPIQQMKKVFNPEVGLKMGTIFPELVSPYAPCQSIREIEYLKNSNQIGEGCNG